MVMDEIVIEVDEMAMSMHELVMEVDEMMQLFTNPYQNSNLSA